MTGTWLDEEFDEAQANQQAGPTSSYDLKPEYIEHAIRDLRELYHSNLIICDTLDVSSTGGRESEYGTMLGRWWQGDNVELWVVGPMRHVFHLRNDGHLDNWDQVIARLM